MDKDGTCEDCAKLKAADELFAALRVEYDALLDIIDKKVIIEKALDDYLLYR